MILHCVNFYIGLCSVGRQGRLGKIVEGNYAVGFSAMNWRRKQCGWRVEGQGGREGDCIKDGI